MTKSLILSIYFDLFYLVFVLFCFNSCIVPFDFSHGKFGLLSPGRASSDRVALPKLQYKLGGVVFP